MSFIDIFLIGIALSMDAFAVSICKGLSVKKVSAKHVLTVGVYFGGSMAALIPSMLIYTVIGDKFDFTNPLFWAFVALDALTVVFGFVYAKKNLIDGGKKASEE